MIMEYKKNKKEKKTLKDKLKSTSDYIKRNSLKPLPFVGFIDYMINGFEKDKLKTGMIKFTIHLLYAGTIMGLTAINMVDVKKDSLQNYRLDNNTKSHHKSVVKDYVDKNNDGISRKEQYKIDTLMNIQNKHADYKPTSEDWERAYKRVKFLDD